MTDLSKLDLLFRVTVDQQDGSHSPYGATLNISGEWSFWLRKDGKDLFFSFQTGREIALNTASFQFSMENLLAVPTFAYLDRLKI